MMQFPLKLKVKPNLITLDTKLVVLPKDVVDYIENLRKLSGRKKSEEVLTDALVFYDWILRRRDDGYKIGAYKETESEKLFYEPDLSTLTKKDG